MISRRTMETLEERGWGYIPSVRLRSSEEFRELVLDARESEGRVTVAGEERVRVERAREQEPLELAVREVAVRDDRGPPGGGAERRYVVCRNKRQARRDRAVREETVAKLRERLGAGAKRLAGNRGFRRYPAEGEDEGEGGRGFRIDEDRIADEERFDGVWALRVKAPLGATEAALKYKELWRVERCFRESKSLLRTRPVFHRADEAIRGHVFRSFLALVLKQDL